MVRILHLSDRLTERGGAHGYLIGLLDALQEEGDEVLLAVGEDEGRVRPRWPIRIVEGLAARTRVRVDLEPLWRELEADLVHLHTVVNPAVLEWAAERPALITVQDHRYFCPSRGKWTAAGRPCRETLSAEACAACFDDPGYFQDVYALTAERLAAVRRLRVHVLSGYMKRELAAAGLPEDGIEVVPPFVHGLDVRAEADGPPCVLFVGRLSAAKGAPDAALAWRRSGLPEPLLMAGSGSLRPALERAGATVLGWVSHERLAPLYRRARAVLLPSRWQEPFGIAGLEALTLGTPVVAWESGGVGEWHPGPLVAWGDVDGLAVALREAVERPRPAPAARCGNDRGQAVARLRALYASVRAGGAEPARGAPFLSAAADGGKLEE
jgi:glycosyltransferase involved in cell wall biosynthesis